MNKIKLDRILRKVDKPARYIGMEYNSIVKELDDDKVKFVFCFPDVYEVGMSHLGMHILYNLINSRDDFVCERVFSPWVDMEEEMRKENLPLLTLENKEEVSKFDFLGFTLQYEMSYTNILNILDLSNIPFYKKDRDDSHPLVIAGGPCAYNPEPLADFIDFFIIGEGEEINLTIMDIYKKHKKNGWNRLEYLKEISKLKGIYVPEFYDIRYKEDGSILERISLIEEAPKVIRKNYIDDLDSMFVPDKMLVPYMDTVHDRIILEMFRGCTHGCRFCQAGMIYRPIREKSPEKLAEISRKLIESTGYEEISLSSLSSCDYSRLGELKDMLLYDLGKRNVSVSLPSLRLDPHIIDMLKEIEGRKTGLTFAPEAGSQRLRNVINKGVNEEDLENTISYAFNEGWSRVKLYYMIGLPTERDEDLLGIRDMGYKVRELFFNRPEEEKVGNFEVNLSAACFVPKPFTPFQWYGQTSIDEFSRRSELVLKSINDKKIRFNYHDPKVSYIEAIFARGDRRLSKVIVSAWEKGCKYDGWTEFFNYDKWLESLKENNIDGNFYATRHREFSEVLPWDFIDIGVSKDYLEKEYKKAIEEKVTPDCRIQCNGCGIENCSMRGVFN